MNVEGGGSGGEMRMITALRGGGRSKSAVAVSGSTRVEHRSLPSRRGHGSRRASDRRRRARRRTPRRSADRRRGGSDGDSCDSTSASFTPRARKPRAAGRRERRDGRRPNVVSGAAVRDARSRTKNPVRAGLEDLQLGRGGGTSRTLAIGAVRARPPRRCDRADRRFPERPERDAALTAARSVESAVSVRQCAAPTTSVMSESAV